MERSTGERFLRGFIFVAPTLALSLLFGFFMAYHIESPKEKQLKGEVFELKNQFKEVQQRLVLVDKVTEAIKNRDEDLYRTALGAEKFPEELRLMGVGGSDAYKSYRGMSNSKLLIQTAKMMDNVERKLHAQSLSFKELVELTKEQELRLASLPAIQPVNNKELKRMASGYGWRVDPVYGTRKMHWGTDFSSEIGTEIYATGRGVAEAVEKNSWGYGNEVVLNHGFGYKTRYAHMSSYVVEIGDTVQRGDLLGFVGSTGKSTGPHLHYEVIKDGHKVNPINYFHSDLTPEQYEKIVEISENAHRSMD
jgi:murein DD-endopeptidase MepM/ murein hydrolase activator NlpD